MGSGNTVNTIRALVVGGMVLALFGVVFAVGHLLPMQPPWLAQQSGVYALICLLGGCVCWALAGWLAGWGRGRRRYQQ